MTGMIPTIRVNVGYDVFEDYRESLGIADDDLEMQKCACGSCGNLVVGFEFRVTGDDRDGEPTGILVGLLRTATKEETIDYLEGIAS